jgi:LDH2 family malate/lactate/ureidoglycolate dehydrogenase
MDSSDDSPCYDGKALSAWSAAVLAAVGMPAKDAATGADVLIRTSLRGVDTHGISRLPLYIDSMLEKNINPAAAHHEELRDGVLHYHGDRGLGQTIGVAAVNAAVKRASEQAVVTCLIHDCGHLAALGTYVLIAAEAGMLAILCQATTPLMALPGWTERAIGNNPLAFATPLAGKAPLVFDMAASVVARGYLRQAVREGTGIPPGWAIGPDGEPTTDAEAAWEGAVLPTGGYKGMGIAMLVQVLAGSLLARQGGGPSKATTGFLLVINPRSINEAYGPDVENWLAVYMKAAGADARYPGQRAAESEASRTAHGIPIPAVLLQQLKDTGTRLGHKFTLEPLRG